MGTLRQNLKELLRQGAYNSIELSQELSIEEREVFYHLEHVRRSLRHEKLIITPYQCQTCDYSFRDRTRLDRPGRCPKCKESHIRMATFTLLP